MTSRKSTILTQHGVNRRMKISLKRSQLPTTSSLVKRPRKTTTWLDRAAGPHRMRQEASSTEPMRTHTPTGKARIRNKIPQGGSERRRTMENTITSMRTSAIPTPRTRRNTTVGSRGKRQVTTGSSSSSGNANHRRDTHRTHITTRLRPAMQTPRLSQCSSSL